MGINCFNRRYLYEKINLIDDLCNDIYGYTCLWLL